MSNLKTFWSNHKNKFYIAGAILLGAAAGGVAVHFLSKSKPVRPVITIDPKYYETFEEAVQAFKELQKTTAHAAMFDARGFGPVDVMYGVFDEGPVVN